MPGNVQLAGHKRRQGPDHPATSSNARKRIKNHDARAIPVQRSQPALSASGELNIASFVKAREFELNAIDKSMTKARTVLSTRAFQQVPRNMRRRTASHNAKKVPRRLRPRARREVSCPSSQHSFCCELIALTRRMTDEGRQHTSRQQTNETAVQQTTTEARKGETSGELEQTQQDSTPEKERGQSQPESARPSESCFAFTHAAPQAK